MEDPDILVRGASRSQGGVVETLYKVGRVVGSGRCARSAVRSSATVPVLSTTTATSRGLGAPTGGWLGCCNDPKCLYFLQFEVQKQLACCLVLGDRGILAAGGYGGG